MLLRKLLQSILLFAAACALGAADAQTVPPQVWVEPAPGQQPIRLGSVAIDVRIDGFVARTRMELVFDNPNDRVLEGEFVFPLAAGQALAGYALDVGGELREGVVVPKETARVAFEDTIRQQIDPGLAELTRGNVFRTRLYPLPARGSKRIVLTLEQVLADAGDHYRYVLPLQFDRDVARFSVHAQARLTGQPPAVDGASPDPALHFDRSGEAWVADLQREHVRPQRELAFRVPKPQAPVAALEAADPLEPAWRTIVAQVDTGLPADAAGAMQPRTIALFVDASASARDRDRARERAALQRWLRGFDAVDVALIAFRDAAEPAQRFSVRGGDATALLAAIDALPLDGGSSYGAIDPALAADADVALVIGDGLSNFGALEPLPARSGRGPRTMHVLHAAQRADHARLARIARSGGGVVVDLAQHDAEQAAAALSRTPWQLLAIDAGAACRDVAPQAPAAVGARLVVTARCTGRAEIALQFGSGGRAAVRRTVAVGAQAPVHDALADSVRRLWAQAAIDALEAQPHPDRDAIVALATRHAVVTRHTSLLVLDRIEDYVRYRVEPKEPALRAQYRAMLAAQPKEPDDPGRAARLERVAALWREFRDWHAMRHPWLETLLLPAANAEAARWRQLAATQPALAKQGDAAQALAARSAALVARWQTDGADPARRAAWERDATALMLQVDALHRERLQHAPDSDDWPTEPAVSIAGADDGERAERSMAEAPAMMEDAPAPMALAAPMPAAPADAGPPPGAAAAKPVAAETPQTLQIQLQGWDPDTPYLAAIRAASDPYAAYLQQREQHGTAPAFFLDCADYFRTHAKLPALALRVLSNIAETGVDDTALTRVLGYRLAQWERYDLAAGQFERALEQRPEEPQSHRDLALALARLPTPDVARAVALLWTVVSRDWHGRFPDIELIALHELNAVLAAAPAGADPQLGRLGIPPALIEPLAVGLRVVMSWDADNTDIDLWVIDPAGEKVWYSQPRSQSGGHVSRDFTQGYGPEIYTIRRPLPGTYRVQAHYYGDRRQSLTGPVTVQIEFQTRFGEARSERQAITRRLETGKELIELGEFVVK